MYAGAVAVPLIVGRALKLTPEQVALLISADLFCCGLVTLIQSLGVTRWFGIRLPVMMGVTFAAVGPMVAMANAMGARGRARHLRRHHRRRRHLHAHRARGQPAAALLPAGGHRHHHRHHRHQPDASGCGLGHGRPGPLAQSVDVPKLVAMVDGAKAAAAAASASAPPGAVAPPMRLSGPVPMVDNPGYGALDNMAVAAFVLVFILLLVQVRQGFRRQHLGAAGHRGRLRGGRGDGQDALRQGRQGRLVRRRHPLRLRHAHLRPVMILTMTLVMIVVMIESHRHVPGAVGHHRPRIAAGRTGRGSAHRRPGHADRRHLQHLPLHQLLQNVGLVGVTGVKSRWVCVAGGVIMIVLGMLPKMAAFVESMPTFVLGGAGLVMFGMVAATGIRILPTVDFKNNRHNLYIVALSIGFGLIPLVAPRWTQQMACIRCSRACTRCWSRRHPADALTTMQASTEAKCAT
jgi:xanthine/uracil permease